MDIGGTFTDVTVLSPRDGSISLGKALTTPNRLSDGVMDALAAAGADLIDVDLVVHGSTVAINALLERDGARTAVVTTRGMRDIYEIGRVNRPDSFNLFFSKHVPLTERQNILEAHERLDAEGEVVQELADAELERLSAALAEREVESVAIVFLHSYRQPAHEQRLKAALSAANPSWYVTASHEISREYREYERTSTTVANAYVGPRVSGYLHELDQKLGSTGFNGQLLLMQSVGGLYDVRSAVSNCIQLLESGPAGGVVGTSALCRQLGIPRAIAFDMGGTTTKACVVTNGEAGLSADYFVGGYNDGLAIRIPVLDIKEIGTGGGSIAWVDEGNALRVGPRSAGALPGPACFGRGGVLPTITDANALLGRLGADSLISGQMHLDGDAAEAALRTHIAEPLGLGVHRAAAGVVAIANAAMANAVRAVTLDRGVDPRDFTLVAYGGAGPLHAVEVARELSITQVVVPPSPGHFSARGMLQADLRRDYVRTYFLAMYDADHNKLTEIFRSLEAEGRQWFAERGIPDVQVTSNRAVDMRYMGQEHTVTVPFDEKPMTEEVISEVKARFDELHGRLYGHSAPEEEAEFVTFRASVSAPLPKIQFGHREGSGPTGRAAAPPSVRTARLGVDGGLVELKVWQRPLLLPGTRITGPAVVQEAATSTVLPVGSAAEIGMAGEIIITVDVSKEDPR